VPGRYGAAREDGTARVDAATSRMGRLMSLERPGVREGAPESLNTNAGAGSACASRGVRHGRMRPAVTRGSNATRLSPDRSRAARLPGRRQRGHACVPAPGSPGPGGGSGGFSGNVTRKVLPWPTLVATSISPP
jgi:hypothetical protein